MFVDLLSPHKNRSSVAAGLLSVLLTGTSLVFLNEGMHPTVVVECSAFNKPTKPGVLLGLQSKADIRLAMPWDSSQPGQVAHL